jgi:phosphotransferase family enzyme
LQYVASHTTVPVPKLHAVHTAQNGFIYLELDYIRGDTLSAVWDDLSAAQRTAIFVELKQHLTILRGLQPPAEGTVCSALQNPAYGCRVGFRFFGPVNHREFHSLLRKHLVWEDVETFLGQQVASTQTSSYRTCFTHADLAPRNIIVRQGRIAAIIDWGFAGWYPEYWEFTKAHYNYFSGEDWEDLLQTALTPYETELEAERILWRMLPEPGTRSSGMFRDGSSFEYKGSDPSASWMAAREGRHDLWTLAMATKF